MMYGQDENQKQENAARKYFDKKVQEIQNNNNNFIDVDFSYEYGNLSRAGIITISPPLSFLQTYALQLTEIYKKDNNNEIMDNLDKEVETIKETDLQSKKYELSELSLILGLLIQVSHFRFNKTAEQLKNCYYLYERVNSAMNRKNMMIEYADFCLNNWKLINKDKSISINNVEMKYKIFDNETERLFHSVMVNMEYQSKNMYFEMFDCIDAVIEKDDNKLKIHLDNLVQLMIKFVYIFSEVTTSNSLKKGTGCPFSSQFNRQKNKEYDTYAWGLSFLKLATCYNESYKQQNKSTDFSGANSSSIAIIDRFINKSYNSEWGQNIIRMLEFQPDSLKQLILSFKNSANVFEYIQNSNNDSLKIKIKLFLFYYTNEYGYFGKHVLAALDALDINLQIGDQTNNFELNAVNQKIKGVKRALAYTNAERGNFDSSYFYGTVQTKKIYKRDTNNNNLALSLKISVPDSNALMLQPGDCIEFLLYNKQIDSKLENYIKQLLNNEYITLKDEDSVLKCLKLRNFIEQKEDLNSINKEKQSDYYSNNNNSNSKEYKIAVSQFLTLTNYLDTSKLVNKLSKYLTSTNITGTAIEILERITENNNDNSNSIKQALADENSEIYIGTLFSFIQPKIVSVNRIHDVNSFSVLKTKTKDCFNLYDGFTLLDNLQINDLVILRPIKNFKENIEKPIFEDDNLTFIVASGSGVSPALCILEQFNKQNNKKSKIVFIYICRYFEQTFNKKLLEQISNNNNIDMTIIYSQEKQTNIENINDTKLKSTINKLQDNIVFSNGDRTTLYKTIINATKNNNNNFKQVNFIFSGILDLVNDLKAFTLTDKTMLQFLQDKKYKFFDEFMHKETVIKQNTQEKQALTNINNSNDSKSVYYSKFFHQTNTRKYWTIVDSNVLDLKLYLNNHPGMSKIIERHVGLDMSFAWKNYNHDKFPKVNYLLSNFLVGTIQNNYMNNEIYNKLVNLGFALNLLENTIYIAINVRDEHDQYLSISNFYDNCLKHHKLKIYNEIEELKKNNKNWQLIQENSNIINENINIESLTLDDDLHRTEDDPRVYKYLQELYNLRLNNYKLLNLVAEALCSLESDKTENLKEIFTNINSLQLRYIDNK